MLLPLLFQLMIKFPKKILASVLFILILATPAFAIAPVLIAAAELAAPSIFAYGIQWLTPRSATINVPKIGYADNYGIRRPMIGKISKTLGIVGVGFIAYNELRTAIADKPSLYPYLHSTINTKQTTLETGTGLPPGSIQKYNGIYYKVTSSTSYPVCSTVNSGTYASPQYGTTAYNTLNGVTYSNGSYSLSRFYVENNYLYRQSASIATPEEVAALPDIESTDSQIKSAISDSSGNLKPEAQDEVDELISANPNLAKQPDSVVKDAQAQKKALQDALQQEAGEKRVAALEDVKAARQAAYDANPTEDNKRLLDEAEAALAEAQADLGEAEEDAVEDAEKKVDDDGSLILPPTPEYEQLNWQPLVDVSDDLSDKFPFSLLVTLKNFATGFVASPQAPVFTFEFPAPFNYTWEVSLSRFDNIATMVRVLIGMSFLAVVTLALIRRWH